MNRNHVPGSAILFAALLFVLGSCATTPRAALLPPDSPEIEYLPLAPGAVVYVFADMDGARPLLNRIGPGGISGGQAAEILDRTRYAAAAMYPAESGQNIQAVAWGNYPSTRAQFAFTFSKDWKKHKSAEGKSYWYSGRNGLSVALSPGQAFVAMGAAGGGQNKKNPLDPFASSPGTASPEGFAEFCRGAVLSLWLENPAAPLDRFLSEMNLPLQIPAEQLLVSLHPVPAEEPQQEAAPGETSYEAHLRIKTPSLSQARAMLTIFSMARLFASSVATASPSVAPPSMTALLPILFANPPVQDGAFLNVRTAPMDSGEIALLFGMFSVYSTQN
ncbi:hypothetical protein AGMMS50255_8460 [Spirochaetia bacterium]|nr:hypothetical protein AGMMS50255_8460 [Spirochaetia bacterium]